VTHRRFEAGEVVEFDAETARQFVECERLQG
jgi:hypothetical protein